MVGLWYVRDTNIKADPWLVDLMKLSTDVYSEFHCFSQTNFTKKDIWGI